MRITTINPLVDRLRHFYATDAARLMLTYIGVIMLMSMSYSLVLYVSSTDQLERQRPPATTFHAPGGNVFVSPRLQTYLNNQIDHAEAILALRLVILNIATLVGGGFLSYYLARRTLEPIERALQSQKQFVSDASHELRTPLTTLRTINEVTLRKKSLTLKEARETMQETIEETERLERLTHSLLALARDNQDNAMRKKAQDIQPLVLESIRSIMANADNKQISIVIF